VFQECIRLLWRWTQQVPLLVRPKLYKNLRSTHNIRLQQRSRWELRSSGLLRSE